MKRKTLKKYMLYYKLNVIIAGINTILVLMLLISCLYLRDEVERSRGEVFFIRGELKKVLDRLELD